MIRMDDPPWKTALYAVATAGLVAFVETFARGLAERLVGVPDSDDDDSDDRGKR